MSAPIKLDPKRWNEISRTFVAIASARGYGIRANSPYNDALECELGTLVDVPEETTYYPSQNLKPEQDAANVMIAIGLEKYRVG